MAATEVARSCSSLHLQLTSEAETLRPLRSVGCSQPLGLCRNVRSCTGSSYFADRPRGRGRIQRIGRQLAPISHLMCGRLGTNLPKMRTSGLRFAKENYISFQKVPYKQTNMNPAQPVSVRSERLSVPEVVELLESISDLQIFCDLPPVRAKGGEVRGLLLCLPVGEDVRQGNW